MVNGWYSLFEMHGMFRSQYCVTDTSRVVVSNQLASGGTSRSAPHLSRSIQEGLGRHNVDHTSSSNLGCYNLDVVNMKGARPAAIQPRSNVSLLHTPTHPPPTLLLLLLYLYRRSKR